MGNTCCNSCKDPHALEDPAGTGPGGEGAKGKPIKMDPKISDEVMLNLKKHEKKIIKIQAVWRGHATRKKLKSDNHIN